MYTKKHTQKVLHDESDWKRIGNEHFVSKNYPKAIKAYTKGLKLDAKNIDLLSNRAAAYLNIDKFEPALTDADEVLNLVPTHLKAIHRKTRALCGMKEFENAKKFILEALTISPDSHKDQLEELFFKTNIFICQSKLGDYPFKIIAQNDLDAATVDWADFEGPVEIKEAGAGRGRGLYATKNISAGQLILASKAFVFVVKNKNLVVPANIDTDTQKILINNATQAELVGATAQSIKANPDKGKILYKLYAGQELNHLDPDSDAYACGLVDMKRIDAICTYNCFAYETESSSSTDVSGLWILPSFINHSCLDCNSFWIIYANFLFVRAFKDIVAGEEITISYISPHSTYTERLQAFKKFNFVCDCRLCEYDRIELKLIVQDKDEIQKKVEALKIGPQEFSPESANVAFALIERFFQVRPQYNLCMSTTVAALAKHYFEAKEFEKAAQLLQMDYQNLKNTPLCTTAFKRCVYLVRALLGAGQKKRAEQWIIIVKQAARIAYGTLEVFELYPLAVEEIQMAMNGLNILEEST